MTGAQLQARRQRAGISLRGLAKCMAISPAYLCDLEWGKRTSQEQLDRAGCVLREMITEKKAKGRR